MCIDFDGHHSDGSSFVYAKMIFVITEIFCIPTGTSSALKKKKSKESQIYGFAPQNRFRSANLIRPGIGA